jgi:hypothetical protein
MEVNQGMNQWLKANRRDCLRTWGDEVSAGWVHRWVLSYSHDVERPSNMIGFHVRPTSTCAPPHTARELSQRAWLVMGREAKTSYGCFRFGPENWNRQIVGGGGVQSWSTFFSEEIFVFGRDVVGGTLHSRGKAGLKVVITAKFANLPWGKPWGPLNG